MVHFSNPRLPLTLTYPDPTPGGFPVTANERATAISYRIHFISDGSGEIYFEVGQYTDLSIAAAMEMFKREVLQNIDEVEIGGTTEKLFKTKPAQQFTIRWPGKKRRITFLEHEDRVYRIIYDPASPINEQILESIKFQ